MTDLLAAIRPRQRFTTRTQAAFVRSYKFLNAGRTEEYFPSFNILSLLRLHDMSPPIYVCALSLLDAEVEQEPDIIRESQQFRNLIDRLGLQPSTNTRDVRNSHKASLILLEIFIYMVVINRARKAEEANKADRRAATNQLYEQEELTA